VKRVVLAKVGQCANAPMCERVVVESPVLGRIAEINVFYLESRLKTPFRWATGALTHRTATLVKVTCDSGVVGWGEAGSHGTPTTAARTIAYVLAPLLIGKEAGATEHRWREMYMAVRPHGGAGIQFEAIAGVDLALWDAKARSARLSLGEMLGGRIDDAVPAYATGFYYGDLDGSGGTSFSDEARQYIDRGFRALKVKIGGLAPAEDLRTLRAVREAVGESVELMVDANRGYDFQTARKLLGPLGELGVLWFEEPMEPQDMSGYRELRLSGAVPISAGESESDLHSFARLTDARAVDILQPDVCVAGGVTQWRKIVAIAEAGSLRVIPHCWGSAVALHTTLQLVSALPPVTAAGPACFATRPGLEWDQTVNPLRTELGPCPELRDGAVNFPGGHGFGFEVDEKLVRRFAKWHWSSRRLNET
jgi:D-galactarolactone cycloisomerase